MKILDLPEFETVRRRIELAKKEDARFCFMAEYLFCARISEVVGLRHPSDITTTARGITGKAAKKTVPIVFLGDLRTCAYYLLHELFYLCRSKDHSL